MNELKELFSDVEEEFDDDMDDWEIPDPEDQEETDGDWAETWLDGLDEDDVDGYDETWWDQDYTE